MPNVPIWERPKRFFNNFLEVILQKLCNTIVLLRDVFHIGLVIGPKPAVLA